jgi:hypothetical protein
MCIAAPAALNHAPARSSLATMSGLEGPAAGRGKWSQPGVPHKRWECVDIEDRGELGDECEMCETVQIRYAHYMQHSEYAAVLQCGCICAGHMEGDLTRAQSRERSMKNAARRRLNFPHLKRWRRSEKGSFTIRYEGYRITIFRKGAIWSGVIADERTGAKTWARREHATHSHAMLAAFDTIIRLSA